MGSGGKKTSAEPRTRCIGIKSLWGTQSFREALPHHSLHAHQPRQGSSGGRQGQGEGVTPREVAAAFQGLPDFITLQQQSRVLLSLQLLPLTVPRGLPACGSAAL